MDNPQILINRQISLLKKIGKNPFFKNNYYLTGGTALAGFYLFHRYSEDLDFFSEKEIDILPINVFFESIKKEFEIEKIDYQQSFNRNLFFLHFKDGEILKTEFTYYPFTRIEKGISKYEIIVDSLLDIGANKLFTVYQRTQIKDYIDLYFICKKKQFNLQDLIKKARIKFDWLIDPIQLGSQFIKITELKDYPKMIKKVKSEDIENFFIAEAKKLKDELF